MASALFQGAKHAKLYSKFRPYPPQNLIAEIINYTKKSLQVEPLFDKAIDIGCGSGQSTVALSPYFKNVLGLDISHSQIKCAKEIHLLPNIEYRVSKGDDLPVSTSSVELVTLCQAIHWFNPLSNLFNEIHRVLVPNGVIAAYGYWIPLPKFEEEEKNNLVNDLIMQYLHEEKLGSYWDKERYIVQNYYADINLPFKYCQRKNFIKKSESSVAEYIGYFSSWSSYQKLLKQDPKSAQELLHEIENKLKIIIGLDDSSENIILNLYTDYFMLIGHQ